MSKNFQLLVVSFLILVSSAAVYFGFQLLTQVKTLEEKMSDVHLKLHNQSQIIKLVNEVGQTLGKNELPAHIFKSNSENSKLKFIEGFYCNKTERENTDFAALEFRSDNRLFIFELSTDDKPSITNRNRPDVTGTHLLYSPYIYFTLIEDGIPINRRFTILNVDSRGYIRQFSLGETAFTNSFCPQRVRDSF